MVKKIFSTFLAMLTLLTSIVIMPNNVSAADIGDSVTVQTDGALVQYGLYYSSPIGTAMDYIVDENGVKSYAYCIEHDKQGVSEVGEYDVTLQPYEDEVVEGMLAYGFPNKNFGLTDKQSFYATKMAIVTYLEGWVIDGWTAGSGGNSDMIAAMKEVYAYGKSYTRPSDSSGYEIKDINFTQNGDYEEYTFMIVSASNDEITISLDGEIPSGTQINGNTTNTLKVKVNENFTVSYTKPEGEYVHSFKMIVDGKGTTNNVVLGVPTSPSHSIYQKYAITMQTINAPIEKEISYSNEVIKDPSEGNLIIYKYENGTTIPLEGAKFEIRSINGEFSNIKTTDSNGQIVFETIPDGHYILNEVQAPKGYVIDYDFPMNFVIDSTSYPDGQEITIHNKKIPSMEIMKIDGETGEPLEGATLEIAYNDGAEKTTVVTGSDGKATFQPPYIGMYTVKEINPPSGYIIEELPQNIYINGIDDVTVTFKNYKDPSITITKHDYATGELLPNAEFSIVNKSTGEVIFEGLTDSNGEITLDGLDEEVYVITEMAPPENYIKVTDSREIIVEEGKSYTIKFDNKLKPSLEITKIDGETGKPLPNTTFRVEREDGSFSSEYTTDSNGKILLEHIDEGVYTITEIIAPNGYVINSTPKTIDVKWQSNNTFVYTLIFDNYTKPSLIVEKYDEATNELLPNAQFSIEGVDNNFLWEGVLSSGDITAGSDNPISGILEDGRIVINGLDEGVYKITEINPPNGYTFSDSTENPRTVIVEKDKTTTVKIDNRPLPDLEILKIDSVTNEPIANVTFEIRKTDGEFVVERQTDENGKINLTDIDEDIYTIKEVSTPNNYILDENNIKTISIKWNGGDNKDGKYELIFENTLKPALVINKLSGLSGLGLKGARFTIEYRGDDGSYKAIGTYTTNDNGQIVLPNMNVGWYRITEISAPPGYQLPSNPTYEIYLDAGQNSYEEIEIPETDGDDNGDIIVSNGGDLTVTYGMDIDEISKLFENNTTVYNADLPIINYPLNSIVIKKIDAQTGELLEGATFDLIKVSEELSGTGGTTIGTYTTDKSGIIVVTGLESGAYIVKEVKPPTNYDIDVTNQQQAWLKEDGTSIIELTFNNYKYGSLVINKMDADTKEPLSNAVFEVTNSKGEYIGTSGNGHLTTDVEGSIKLENLPPDSYVITEIKAPANYAIDHENNVKVVDIGYGETKEIDFYNKAYSTLVIRKLDTDTKEPLSGAEFKITTSDGAVVGNSNGIYTTDENGLITISDLPVGSYVVTETKAPTNYILSNNSQTIDIKGNATQTLTFYNTKKSSAQILKIDSETKKPLKDAEFKVYKANGELVGTYVTDGDGLIILPHLENGWYKCIETKSPDGYLLDDTAKDFEIKGNEFIKLVFENKKLTSLQIKKVDEITNAPLSGATFSVTELDGTFVGEYTTGADGFINIPNLEPNWYIITETKAPANYILDNSPKTVEVKTNTPTIVTFTNKALSGLTILKLDGDTKKVLQGAEFTVTKMNGESILNEFSSPIFTTDATGRITIPNLENGNYIIKEVSAPEGYILSSETKTVAVESGKNTTVEFLNQPYSGLVIYKTDSKTGKPLQGVTYDIKKANGERVTGNIIDGNQFDTENNSPNKEISANGSVTGSYITDKNGRILLNNLEAGEYHVVETKALDGYVLDETIHSVTVVPGKQAVLNLENEPMAGLRIKKIDSVTKLPIYGVEFRLYDFETNKEVGGPYYTDNNGIVDFDGIIEAGRYTIKETEPAPNYIRDDIPKTIEFKEGSYTEIVWENTPLMGQIQITKKSASDNYTNGLPQGTPLANAVFEVYDYKTGNVVDQFVTKENGVGVSRPLPLGRYIVKEIKAPMYYSKSDKELDVTIEFSSQILKYEFANESANVGVTIKKVGPSEVVNGQEIKYDIKTVKNDSKVALTDFYFRDVVPKEVRVTKIVTGTYNQGGTYKIMYKTNKNDYRVAYDNLNSTANNVVDMSPAALGIYSDEYVTEFMFVFGNVKAGFMQVETPAIYGNVTGNLPNGYQFANKVDIGGKYQGEWVIGNSTWVTTVYNPNNPTLPRTGY